jgi:hypothetical protein
VLTMFAKVFIVLTAVGGILLAIFLPKTKGVPLEEMAKLFGDVDEIQVFAADIHVDHNTHELVVAAHDGSTVTHITRKENVSLPAKNEMEQRVESA